MVLLAGLLVSAIASLAARTCEDGRGDLLRILAHRSAIGATAGTVVTIALGEGLAADEHVHARWLDVSRGLAVFGLLLGGAVLVVLGGMARDRRRLTSSVAAGAVGLTLTALALAFVMASKP
jgi:hypothetical protein